MELALKVTYINRTPAKALIVLEPWAEEYWIEPGVGVDIEVRNGTADHHLEVEHTTHGLTIYGWEGSVISIFRDGKELPPSPQGR
jgi:hypothetical protein